MSRTSNQYVYILWDKEGTIEYVGKGQGKRIYESCREKKSFGGTIFKRNLSEQIALSMEAALIDHFGIHNLRNKVQNGAEPMNLLKFPPKTHGTRKLHPMKYVPKICSKDHYERYKDSLKLQHQKLSSKLAQGPPQSSQSMIKSFGESFQHPRFCGWGGGLFFLSRLPLPAERACREEQLPLAAELTEAGREGRRLPAGVNWGW